MSTGSRPDPTKQKEAYLHASYLNVKTGQKDAGYKAGEVYGCFGHRTYAHKPCVKEITHGELTCPYCVAGLVPEWRGYVPIWDRDWALRYNLIGYEIFESVDAIPHRAQVSISRAKNPISPLIIREELCLTRELPNKAPWNELVDMERVCLALWKEEPLTRWVMSHRVSPSVESGAPLSLPEKLVAGERGNLKDYVGLALGDKAESVNRVKRNQEFIQAAKAPAMNGKPKKQ
jgi:hypothetical protein